MRFINTVCGEKQIFRVGLSLRIEHLMIDLTNQFSEPVNEAYRRLAQQRVNSGNIEILRCNPYKVKDNLLLDDVETAIVKWVLSKIRH